MQQPPKYFLCHIRYLDPSRDTDASNEEDYVVIPCESKFIKALKTIDISYKMFLSIRVPSVYNDEDTEEYIPSNMKEGRKKLLKKIILSVGYHSYKKSHLDCIDIKEMINKGPFQLEDPLFNFTSEYMGTWHASSWTDLINKIEGLSQNEINEFFEILN